MDIYSYRITNWTNTDPKISVTFTIQKNSAIVTTRTIIVNGGKPAEFVLRKIQIEVDKQREKDRNDIKFAELQDQEVIVSD